MQTMVTGFGPEDILADIPKAGTAKLSKFLQWKSISFPSGCKGNNIVDNFGTKRLVREIGDGKRGRVRKKPKTPAAINRAEERKAKLREQSVPVPSPSTDTFYAYGAKLRQESGDTIYWPTLDFNLRGDYLTPDAQKSVVHNGMRRFCDKNDSIHFLCLFLLLTHPEFIPPKNPWVATPSESSLRGCLL